jgi:hypothetical protein
MHFAGSEYSLNNCPTGLRSLRTDVEKNGFRMECFNWLWYMGKHLNHYAGDDKQVSMADFLNSFILSDARSLQTPSNGGGKLVDMRVPSRPPLSGHVTALLEMYQSAVRTAEYAALARLLPPGPGVFTVMGLGANSELMMREQVTAIQDPALRARFDFDTSQTRPHPHACRILPGLQDGYGGVACVKDSEYKGCGRRPPTFGTYSLDLE